MELRIAIGDTESNVIDDPKSLFSDVLMYAPAALGGVTTVMVSHKRAADALLADYVALQSGGADVTLTAAKGTPLTVAGWASMLLQTTVTVAGADEVYQMTGAPAR